MSETENQIPENTPWVNPLKRALREGQVLIGGTVTVPSVEVAAQMASLGFDFLWLEMEHSPITLETLRNMILAMRGLPAVPVARVPVNETWMAKRVLDAGALGVVFPFTSTPELARQAAEACHYPPRGRRGFGPGLAMFRWPAPQGYVDFADNNAVVIANIEEAQAIDNIDAIAATPDLDVLFIGSNDLAYSLGLRGNQEHPQLREAMDKVLEAGQRHGKAVGAPVRNAAQVEAYVERGFRFFQSPADVNFLAAGARTLLDPLGKSAAVKKPTVMY